MTISVTAADRWRKLHSWAVWSIVASWSGLIGVMVGFPEMNCTLTRGLALGVGAMLPQVGLGLGLWHRTKRSGIVMPIALLVFRFLGSSLLFAIFLWQFPTEQKIIAWSGSTLIIVFTSLEAIFFARGVDRL